MRYKSCVIPYGTQLGRLRRLILLEAAPAGQERVRAVLPLRPGASAQTSMRNAVGELEALRFIDLTDPLRVYGVENVKRLPRALVLNGWATPDDFERVAYATTHPGGRYKNRVAIRGMVRTPLGDDVVARYRRELESALTPGRLLRIRWRS